MQEILAQSHTTGAVLQVALNYIEVLRPKLADLTRSSATKEMGESLILISLQLLKNSDVPSDVLEKQVLMNLLPSPLLCPRRVFLAAIILASKFLEDICILNRHWAKISGLPAWEIGRCERALGEALDWRLWILNSKDVSNRLQNVA